MRYVALFALLALAACTQATFTPASSSRVDNRTFVINGPGIPGGSIAPNKRLAERLCPNGFRVLDSVVRRNSSDGYADEIGDTFTNWTIRCL
ncbi:MAG TPA: hypothetical protein VMF86_17240 [Stellaceae bacterium]|nr:hypothetical protein [Stellaceae bacterium]